MSLYEGTYNWQNEIHKLWTQADTSDRAKRNFIAQMAKLLGVSNYRLRCYFDGEKNNFNIREETRDGWRLNSVASKGIRR